MSPSAAVVISRQESHHNGGFVCRDCGKEFASAAEFSDHFTRLQQEDGRPGVIITGCKKVA
jgi:hypothetical protein